MKQLHDEYIHDLSEETILSILQSPPWKLGEQAVSSAKTNDNDFSEPNMQLLSEGDNTAGINAFYDITFKKHVKHIVDIGGGRFDCNQHYMKHSRGIELLVWDPFNRSKAHNVEVQKKIQERRADAVTSMSVLNVIPDVKSRLTHIVTCLSAIKIGGQAYFKIWPGDGNLRGSFFPIATNQSYQANAFSNRFLREVQIVFGFNNVKIDPKIPNLIVANKVSEAYTSLSEMKWINHLSRIESNYFLRIRENFIRNLSSKLPINTPFFASFFRDEMYRLRVLSDKSQTNYDKHYGMIKR